MTDLTGILASPTGASPQHQYICRTLPLGNGGVLWHVGTLVT